MNCDREYGVCSEDVSYQPGVALQDSGHGKFCTGVAYEVQNCGSSRACGERLRSVASGKNGTHGLHAARRAEKVSTTVREGTLDKSMPITGRQVFKDGKKAKRQRHHSWSTSGEATARQTTLAKV